MQMPGRQGRQCGKWSAVSLRHAVQEVKSGKMSLRDAEKEFGIPKSTLSRHISEKNKIAKMGVKYYGHAPTFDLEMEEEIVGHCLRLESMYFGLRIEDLRRLAFDLAKANNVKHSFNVEKGMAGKKWFYGFMKRHPSLSVREPESTSLARAQGFNKERVEAYFEFLAKIYDEESLTPDRLYNMDESSLSTVQDGQCLIIAERGKKRIGAVTSNERGESVTGVVCVSASGNFVPPMLIYKRKRMKAEMTNGAPPGTVFSTQEKGWMSNNGFVEWLKHFIYIVKPVQSSKVVLILDGHVSHAKNLEAIELARESGVRMVSLPPHTTHRLQPLDVSFFGPLGTYYNDAMRTWMRTHTGRAVTTWQVAELFGQAYGKAASVAIATSGFRASGIWPLNFSVFNDNDFIASSVTDVPVTRDQVNNSLVSFCPPWEPNGFVVDVNDLILSTGSMTGKPLWKSYLTSLVGLWVYDNFCQFVMCVMLYIEQQAVNKIVYKYVDSERRIECKLCYFYPFAFIFTSCYI